MLNNIRNILLIVIVVFITYFGTHVAIQGFDNYQNYAIQKDLQTGAPAYFGPCPEVVNNANIALGEDRYLSQHLSFDGKENLKFYKIHILGYINGSFSFAATCSDPEAVGRLLYNAANITLDIALDKGMSYNEAVFLAESYYKQAFNLGYSKNHKMETSFLAGRIERNIYRMQHNTNV